MNYLTDLIECLRPVSETDLQENMNAMLKAQEQIQEEENSCDYCKSYSGEKPVARFVMKDLISGLTEVTDLCSDCINQDEVFLNKKIIETINL
jgi:hypothetical protein